MIQMPLPTPPIRDPDANRERVCKNMFRMTIEQVMKQKQNGYQSDTEQSVLEHCSKKLYKMCSMKLVLWYR